MSYFDYCIIPTDDNVVSGTIECDFRTAEKIQFIVLQEYIKLGQRVKSFNGEVFQDRKWKRVANATTIGYKRILKISPLEANKVRVNITGAKACLAIANLELG